MSATNEVNRLDSFSEIVYRTLRLYQDGQIKQTNVCVGKLDDELTVVYDTIIGAGKKLAEEMNAEDC
jgi:hypothetical protein